MGQCGYSATARRLKTKCDIARSAERESRKKRNTRGKMKMNKLAERREYGCACWSGDWKEGINERYFKLLDRLADYEDIGLTPDEIKSSLRKLAKYEELGTVKELEDALYDLSF